MWDKRITITQENNQVFNKFWKISNKKKKYKDETLKHLG